MQAIHLKCRNTSSSIRKFKLDPNVKEFVPTGFPSPTPTATPSLPVSGLFITLFKPVGVYYNFLP